MDQADERCQELKAQILFRMEEWAESFGLYQNLLRNCIDSFEQERITNFVACAAMVSQFATEHPENIKIDNLEGSMPEAAFNAACYHTGVKVILQYFEIVINWLLEFPSSRGRIASRRESMSPNI